VPEIRGSGLRVSDIAAAARGRGAVGLAPEARARVAAEQAHATRVAATRPIYGRSTGVGANRQVAVPDAHAAARGLLRSHASSDGPARSEERVRAMLVVRLNQLAAGGNGIDPAVLDAVVALLATGPLPRVREGGSVGTGDLAALATVALTLEERHVPGRLFGPGDSLTFLSSNAGAIGDAALAVADLERLADAALVVAALTWHGVRGNAEAYSVAAEATTPFPGAGRVCRALRGLTGAAGSPYHEPARIQDPFGLRCLPQVHGALLDRLAETGAVVEAMAGAAAENPVISSRLGVAHHGGFHAAYLGQALDALRLATAQAAQLALARVSLLMDPALTGAPAFLADGTPGASGAMVVEYDAAAALGDLRALAHPASLQTVSLSRGMEEDASFAALAARQALACVPSLRSLLACELVAAHRCLLITGAGLPDPLGPVGPLLAGLGTDLADRDLTDDLATAATLLDDLAPLTAGY
jgi:histidine ammonia-lyase